MSNSSSLYAVLSINSIATLLILLLFTHFIYNIYIQKRNVATTIRIKISNQCHFQTVSLIQTFIFILSLTSCIIVTLFISNIILSTISSTTCSTIYAILYCCWFIARYLVILMFIFRLHNITKLFSSHWKKLLTTIALIATIINIPIIVIYGYITSPYLIDIESSNMVLCTDETQWLNAREPNSNVSYLILNSINILLIIMIFGIYIHQIHFVKTHNVSSIFSYSYQSLSSSKLFLRRKHNSSQIDDEKTISTSSDIIATAVAATLHNKDVTIGANRRKRNYTSNPSLNPKTFIPKPEIFNRNNEKILSNNSSKTGKNNTSELVKMRTKNVDENTAITLTVKQNNNNDINKSDTKSEQFIEDLRFVVQKEFIFQCLFVVMVVIDLLPTEFMHNKLNKGVIDLCLNGIHSFINCLCSVMLFHSYNDVWYDIMRCLQCYCFYDCCWKYCNCFICDNDRNCYTFCCKLCVKQKVQHDNKMEDDKKMNGTNDTLNGKKELNDNGNNKNDEQKSIYVRGSLRRLHQK